ncbi:hypothetical protein MRB53_012106 [Persea americana]|uniref:Uncharacterized protein n=1 Tax=Persea americana TaxID=3435 RepID=A0ACC2LWL9_PERAE|nr:hypothetical protein MRB53_012106 [Persea americana]
MTFRSSILRFPWTTPAFHVFLLLQLLFPLHLSGLNTDGNLLLSLKYSVLSDPGSVLGSWSYSDQTPCSWKGVACTGIPGAFDNSSRVVSLVLPNAKLLGSIPPDLGYIQFLRHLDLSHNSFNGTLPFSLFNASELRILDLSDNEVSGGLPELVGNLKNLQFLNLSSNALTGKIPDNLTALTNLTVVSLSNNYFSGDLPKGFDSVEILDLASNLVNGSLPPDLGGGKLRSLNLSYNRLSGEISSEFGSRIPANASLDLSFNNLTGEIPDSLIAQKAGSFAGNSDLCGKPLKNPCGFSPPSEVSPNASTPSSPPAFAAFPKTTNATGDGESPTPGSSTTRRQSEGGMKPGVIAGIVVGDLAGIGILSMLFLCMYEAKKRKKRSETVVAESKKMAARENEELSSESRGRVWSCLSKKGGKSNEEDTTESESEEGSLEQQQRKKTGSLVTVDGESVLELETLLKASAYILGATATSIVYKAVLEDGTSFAVRRIGESGLSRFRDFENQVKAMAKLRHPNLVRIRGFYWGEDEKLVIYDYVPNGSLANATYKKMGSSSPRSLPWDVRLRIARGVARGLTYLHEKKYVHGNLKPSNILLGPDMDPKIGDFGLERLVSGDTSSKTHGDSARHFGSKRSTLSRESLQDLPTGTTPSPSPSLSTGGPSPYHAPESLKNLKPHPKWDVYSFGIVLLELVSGKVYSEAELTQWTAGFAVEDNVRLLRMADVAIRAELEANEDALLACFKLGFSCASVVPQKRPCMKEALQILDKLPSSSPHFRFS